VEYNTISRDNPFQPGVDPWVEQKEGIPSLRQVRLNGLYFCGQERHPGPGHYQRRAVSRHRLPPDQPYVLPTVVEGFQRVARRAQPVRLVELIFDAYAVRGADLPLEVVVCL